MKDTYIFSHVRMHDVSLSFNLQRLFFTVYSSGGVTLCILKLWTVLLPIIGGMITDSRSPTSCDTNMCWRHISVTDFTICCPH